MASMNSKTVRVEMGESTLIRLLETGQVCARDFRCLDCRSKQNLWRLCLKSCVKTKCSGLADPPVRKEACYGCGVRPERDVWKD